MASLLASVCEIPLLLIVPSHAPHLREDGVDGHLLLEKAASEVYLGSNITPVDLDLADVRLLLPELDKADLQHDKKRWEIRALQIPNMKDSEAMRSRPSISYGARQDRLVIRVVFSHCSHFGL